MTGWHGLAALLACGLAAGCAAPLLEYSVEVPALQMRGVGQPAAVDGRQRFREIFCALAAAAKPAQAQTECEHRLVRLADEAPTAGAPRPLPVHDPGLRILFVPGAFGECVADVAPPYPEAMDYLSELGYAIRVVPVSGRSGTTYNAALIAEAVAAEPVTAAQRLVLIGYSKGAADILEFLVQHPAQAQGVDAVVSIAGAVNGTPLADAYADVYGLLAGIGLSQCAPGDREVVNSLRQESRMNWLARHRLPGHVRYFSLGAIAQEEDIARLLYLAKRRLRRAEPLHDGQILAYHQIIPASTLLGYAYADHWAVALPLQQQWPYWAGNRAGSRFPRKVLLEAVVLYLVEALGRDESSGESRR